MRAHQTYFKISVYYNYWHIYEYIWEVGGVILFPACPQATIQGGLCPENQRMLFEYFIHSPANSSESHPSRHIRAPLPGWVREAIANSSEYLSSRHILAVNGTPSGWLRDESGGFREDFGRIFHREEIGSVWEYFGTTTFFPTISQVIGCSARRWVYW